MISLGLAVISRYDLGGRELIDGEDLMMAAVTGSLSVRTLIFLDKCILYLLGAYS